MTKNDLLKIKKYSDFTKALKILGYEEQPKKSGSHRKFKTDGKSLSIPCHNNKVEIPAGIRRKLVKIIFSD